MNELKERLEIEKQSWIENYMKKQVRLLIAFCSLSKPIWSLTGKVVTRDCSCHPIAGCRVVDQGAGTEGRRAGRAGPSECRILL